MTLPAVVFNNRFDHFSGRISDPAVRALLSDGQAYEHGTKLFIDPFQGTVRDEIVSVCLDSVTALQKGSHKGRHLQECCIFENSKLGRKEEKGRASNYTALYQGRVRETTLDRRT
jgi:hypothetical protein